MTHIANKPWGYEELLRHNIKILHILKGKRLSLQYHKDKEEFIVCLVGLCEFELGNIKGVLVPGGYLFIPKLMKHRLSATTNDVELFEVFDGVPTEVVRLEDDYGRIECVDG